VVDSNGAAAAIRAGYSQKTAAQQASRLLTKVKVQRQLEVLHARLHQSLNITAERILQEYARIAFFDPRRLRTADGKPLELHELDADTAAAIAGAEEDLILGDEPTKKEKESGKQRLVLGVTRKLKIANKLGALDSLAKIQGLFKQMDLEDLPITVTKTYYGQPD